MPGSILFLASAAILYYVLRYRIHIHIEISHASAWGSPGRSRRAEFDSPAEASSSPSRQRVKASGVVTRTRGGELRAPDDRVRSTATTRPAISRVQDITSALVNLQAKPQRAKAAAEHVVRNWPDADFDTQFRAAVKEVQAA